MPDNAPSVRLMQSGWRYLLVTLLILAVDQWTKYLAETYIEPMQPIELLPFFNLVIAYNSGAAFSFLADASGWQKYFFSAVAMAVSVVLIVWLRRLHWQRDWMLSLSLSMILGGALGNLYDRLVFGHVVDFIDWHYAGYHFPAFNIADSAIFCGAVLMIWDSFKNDRSET